MSTGVEIRARLDAETARGLLLINGGAAVALLAFLPTALENTSYDALARAIMWGLLSYQAGLFFALAHNRARRMCSLIYNQHNFRPPPCEFHGRKVTGEPCVCLRSKFYVWLSLIFFCVGGIVVFIGGMHTLNRVRPPESKPVPKIQQSRP
jgi:hypothetical protein